MNTAEIRDARFRDVVGDDLRFERLGTGFAFTEGPLWHAGRQTLYFSDMPGDIIRSWTAAGGVAPFRTPSRMANGLAWDRGGRLLACEHATSQVTRTESDGSIRVVASHYEGKALNSPNDLVVKSDGAIYFSDPTFGRMPYYGLPRPTELAFRGVYRLDPDGRSLRLLADDFGQPNGLCFSADEQQLFVNDTERQHIRRFEVTADGGLQGGQVWAETTGDGEGAPDGMKFDAAGHLYSCGPGGIHVFDAAGTCLGVIRVPETTANFTWGDADLRSLFITASTSLYRLRVRTPGRPAVA